MSMNNVEHNYPINRTLDLNYFTAKVTGARTRYVNGAKAKDERDDIRLASEIKKLFERLICPELARNGSCFVSMRKIKRICRYPDFPTVPAPDRDGSKRAATNDALEFKITGKNIKQFIKVLQESGLIVTCNWKLDGDKYIVDGLNLRFKPKA